MYNKLNKNKQIIWSTTIMDVKKYKTDIKQLERMWEKRKERAKNGLCLDCGHKRSSKQHEKRCLARRRKTRQNYSSKGLCRDCKKSLKSDHHIKNCLEKRRNQNGICVKCNCSIYSEEHEKCKNKSRELKKVIYAKAIKNNTCSAHTSREAVTRGRCEECWFRSMARNAIGGKAGWKIIKDLFEKQYRKCAYTGNYLRPGDNASVDHKTPTSREGKREISNIQWVDFKINKLKSGLTHEEFLLVCKFNWEKYHNTQEEYPDKIKHL